MNVRQLSANVERLIAATHVPITTQNALTSNLLQKKAKVYPPKFDSAHMVPKGKQLIDIWV